MQMGRLVVALVVMLGLGGSLTLALADAPAGVTMAEAQADFAAKKYPECLQKIAKLLDAAGTTPSENRAAIFLLKGECLIQEKQSTTASEAFTATAGAYPPKDSKEGKDPNNKNGKYWVQIATANATSLLIKRAGDFQYTPKTGKDKTSLSIMDPAGRPAALTALFNDELSADQAAAKPLMQGATPALPPIVDFAPKVHDLQQLEVAATGDDKQSVTLETELAAAAKKGIDSVLALITRKADTAATDATKMITTPGTGGSKKKPAQSTQKPRGLTESERENLQGDVTTLEKLPPWIKTLQTSLDQDPNYFQSETTESASLKTKIQGLLTKG